jgi:hypothetical protein
MEMAGDKNTTAHFKVLFNNSVWRTSKNHRNSVKIASCCEMNWVPPQYKTVMFPLGTYQSSSTNQWQMKLSNGDSILDFIASQAMMVVHIIKKKVQIFTITLTHSSFMSCFNEKPKLPTSIVHTNLNMPV